jgi:hypothetical protein
MTTYGSYGYERPLTVAEQSKAYPIFVRSETGIMGSNPTQVMDDYYMYVFILCLCCLVFRYRPCDELITRSGSPTGFKTIMILKNHRPGPKGGCRASEKKMFMTVNTTIKRNTFR